MGEESLESTTMDPSFLTRMAIGLSMLKYSALQLMPSIFSPPDKKDESAEYDLQASINTHQPILPVQTSTTHLTNVSGQSSTLSQSPYPHELSCECPGRQKLSNPVAQAFRELELGKAFLTFIMPMAAIFLAVANKESSAQLVPSILCLISAAFVFLFCGNALRNIYPKIANVVEQLGTACIYTSFFMAVGSHLPPTLVWFPLICFIACITMSLVSCLPLENKKCWYCKKIVKP